MEEDRDLRNREIRSDLSWSYDSLSLKFKDKFDNIKKNRPPIILGTMKLYQPSSSQVIFDLVKNQ